MGARAGGCAKLGGVCEPRPAARQFGNRSPAKQPAPRNSAGLCFEGLRSIRQFLGIKTGMNQIRKLRVGMIGAGNISEFHMRAVSRVGGAQVTAIVDSDLNRAEALARKWSVGRWFATTGELFDS